jgi:hypothetical protein
MSNHGLFVGVSALALALAAKMARRSLISAWRRAMAKRWSSSVALVSPLGCRRKGFPNVQVHLAQLELELIQTHMAQKPLLWIEMSAHAVRNRSKFGVVGWAGAGVTCIMSG